MTPSRPHRSARGYTRRARAAGDDADVVVVLNTGHVELVAPGSEAWDIEAAMLKDMLGVKPTP